MKAVDSGQETVSSRQLAEGRGSVGSGQSVVGRDELQTADCKLPTNKLPKGWAHTDLANICTIVTGKKDVNEGNPNGKYPFFTCAQEVHKIDDYAFEGKALLIAGNGFFNVKHYEGRFDAYQRTYVLQNFKANDRYLYWYIQFRLDEITKDNRGSTIQYIRLGDLAYHQVFIPPLNEQKRIVAKLDAIMPRIEAVKARLDKVPGILKRFRQSVLTAAVTGKLTEQWREEHPEVESIIESLERGIPDTWKLSLAKDCCDHITKGTTPKNGGFSTKGVPFLKVYNIVDNKIDFEYKPQFVTEEIHKTFLKRSIVFPGTVIMNIVGPPLGKVAVIPDTYPEWNLNQAIAIFRPQEGLFNKYLFIVLTEGFCLKQILIDTRGVVGQSNLSLEQCQNLEIPHPPLEEQREIVRQVDKLFDLADKVEAHYQKAKVRVDKLSQSVLAKAFRGELVPQDTNDLPAAELLKQILAEKERLSQSTQRTRRIKK